MSCLKCLVCIVALSAAAMGQETPGQVELSAESIREAQSKVLNRILREADSGDPAQLLKLSQTLSTLQAAEGQQDMLMVARAVEPQLQHLPQLAQQLQKQLLKATTSDMLGEFRRHGGELLPVMRGFIQVWGNSLEMGEEVQRSIEAADAEAATAAEEKEAAQRAMAERIVRVWKFKYVAQGDYGYTFYEFVRRPGALDAIAHDIMPDVSEDELLRFLRVSRVVGSTRDRFTDLDPEGLLVDVSDSSAPLGLLPNAELAIATRRSRLPEMPSPY